tara:strand:+ start:39 stop:869 length:831 start_codon:yes stop_codon:yes gene_type:complete
MESKKTNNINIAVITGGDKNILLPTWDKTIRFLKKKNIYLKGFIYSKKQTCNLQPIKLYSWYLNTFGIKIFFLLIIFNYFTKIIRIFKNLPTSFKNLSKRNNIPFFYIENCEQKFLINWIKENKIDVLLITTEDILNKELIKSVKKAIINKHASILPNSRGLWPFFWNVINSNDQGVTYHIVSNKIDSGKILLQKKIKKGNDSMIGYYLKIFNDFPNDIYQSLRILYKLERKKNLKKKIISSYNSLPKKKDFIIFKKKGGKIILYKDFIRALNFNK